MFAPRDFPRAAGTTSNVVVTALPIHPGPVQTLDTTMTFLPAKLALEDGTVYAGRAFGTPGETAGEVVFNTSMTGYQEVLTDPSYKGQIVTMTYPLIGNYGINPDDRESGHPQVEGFIVRELTRIPSNFRSHLSLDEHLKEYRIPGIEGIDTRALVRRLRVRGAMKGILSAVDLDNASLVRKARGSPGMVGRDLVREVVPDKAFTWADGFTHPLVTYLPSRPVSHHVVALDFGMKWNILRCLVQVGCKVTVLPGTARADDVLAQHPDGIFLSNGPGDPAALGYAIDTVANLVGKKPMFGICLGHQLLGLALGARDLQAEVRPSRRQPAGAEPAHRLRRDHHAEPRLCRGHGIVAGRPRSDAHQPERWHPRGHAAPALAALQRPVSP